MRLVVAIETRPSSSSASRHCSSSARSSPSFSRRAVSSVPVTFLASARTRTFSSIDQVFDLRRWGTISGRLRASRSHRDKVSCEMPESRARALALAASFPVSCSTIFCLNPSEKGLVTVPSLPRPRRKKGGSDNYAAAGGRQNVLPVADGGLIGLPPYSTSIRPTARQVMGPRDAPVCPTLQSGAPSRRTSSSRRRSSAR